MKHKTSDILSQAGRQSGFKVPENYFEDFTSKMEDIIPQHQVIPEIKPTMWNRIRPYVYLAAMFAGIWCMMWIFNDLARTSKNGQYNLDIVAGFQHEENIDEILMYGDISEYDIYTYKDSVAADEANDLP